MPGSTLVKHYGDPLTILFGLGGDEQEAERRAVGADPQCANPFCPEVIGERVGDKIAAILTALQYAMR